MAKFINDSLWKSIKTASREWDFEYDWLKIVSFYNLYGGKNVQVFVIDKDKKYRKRVLAVTDNNLVVLLDKENNISYLNKDEGDLLRKAFTYNKSPVEKVTKNIEYKVNNNNNIEYYI